MDGPAELRACQQRESEELERAIAAPNLPSVSRSSVHVAADIGGTTIEIGAPPTFREVSSVSAEIREFGQRLTRPANRLLGIFVSEEDVPRIMKGEVRAFLPLHVASNI